MRPPWLQVELEVLEQSAPDLSVMLGCAESAIGWGLLKMFRWALGRCPESKPPSASSTVAGPEAVRLLARRAEFDGDPEEFVSACERVQPPLLERTPEGVRVRGLDRYDAYWGKSHPDEWKAWKASRDGSAPEPEQNRPESVPVPARKIEMKIEIQTEQPPPPTPSARSKPKPAPLAVVREEEEPKPDSAYGHDPDGTWGWTRKARRKRHPGVAAEVRPPDFDAWQRAAVAEVGLSRLSGAYLAYLEDPWAIEKGCPTSLFILPTVWTQRVPPAEEPARRRL